MSAAVELNAPPASAMLGPEDDLVAFLQEQRVKRQEQRQQGQWSAAARILEDDDQRQIRRHRPRFRETHEEEVAPGYETLKPTDEMFQIFWQIVGAAESVYEKWQKVSSPRRTLTAATWDTLADLQESLFELSRLKGALHSAEAAQEFERQLKLIAGASEKPTEIKQNGKRGKAPSGSIKDLTELKRQEQERRAVELTLAGWTKKEEKFRKLSPQGMELAFLRGEITAERFLARKDELERQEKERAEAVIRRDPNQPKKNYLSRKEFELLLTLQERRDEKPAKSKKNGKAEKGGKKRKA